MGILNITAGNDHRLRLELKRWNMPMNVFDSSNLVVRARRYPSNTYELQRSVSTTESGVIEVKWPMSLPVGIYGIEIAGVLEEDENQGAWRVYGENTIRVTNATEKDSESVTLNADSYDVTITMTVMQGTGGVDEELREEVHAIIEEEIGDAEAVRESNEAARQENESTRQNNEGTRKSNEVSRGTKETERQDAETLRSEHENTRQNNETRRQDNETTRQSQETTRQNNESTRNSNEQTRESKERERQEAERLRSLAEQDRQANENQRMRDTAAAIDIAIHPDYVGVDNYIHKYNPSTHAYEKSEIYVKGENGEDGVGVQSVEQVTISTESGGVNVWRITLTNGITQDFEVRNGEKVVPTVENEILTF